MEQDSDTSAGESSESAASWLAAVQPDGEGAPSEKIEILWGTILASIGNPSPEMTLKSSYDSSADGASWASGATSAPLTLGQTFAFPTNPGATRSAPGGASITIRTSRLSHTSTRYGDDIANVDGSDFVITTPLGRGGMGIVYSARQSSLNRDVAVKMIAPAAAGRDEYRRKMVSEALITGELEHPNIIPIYELGRTESDDLFYAMKIVNGEPWSQSLADKSERENIDILLRVCDAVAFAHDKGIIHRDLKPSNIMLGSYGEVLLMDWGLAVSLQPSANAEQLSPANSMAGTPAYMSPEMALGNFMLIGTASDIYLLGAILYEILTGTRPHSGASAGECLKAAADNFIGPVPSADELARVALRAMATDPSDRYGAVKDFQNAIITVQTHRESHALAANAEQSLAGAVASREYDGFAQAIFAYNEAIKLWRGNAEAVLGRVRARKEYARCAYEKGDYDLALSSLEGLDDGEAEELASAATAARNEANARQRRVRFLTRAAIGLTVAVVVILGASTVIISDRMAAEREARQAAGRALEETQVARRNERTAAAEREAALLAQREAQDESLRASMERELALKREMEALARAEEERRRKEEAERAHLAIERELTRKGQLEDNSWWGFDSVEAKRRQESASATWNIPVTLTAPLGEYGNKAGFILIPPGGIRHGQQPEQPLPRPGRVPPPGNAPQRLLPGQGRSDPSRMAGVRRRRGRGCAHAVLQSRSHRGNGRGVPRARTGDLGLAHPARSG